MYEEILLSLSLSVGLCLGIPMVVWTLYSLKRHQEAGGHISAFIVSLIFSDIMEILLSPFVNTRFLEEHSCHKLLPCWVLYSTFAEARVCGLHFHQLVALDGILSIVYPSRPVRFLCLLILSLTVWIFVISCNFFTFGYTVNFTMCVVPLFLAVVTSVLTIRTKHLTSAGPLNRTDYSVLAVAWLTLVVIYMPCLVLSIVQYPVPFYESPWATMAVSIMSFRVVTEPLLCVLVCRKSQQHQTPQRRTAAGEVQVSD